MRRRTFDALLTTSGMLVATILLVAGGLLTWAHSFVNDQVTNQLASQQIFFPAKGSAALDNSQIKPYLEQYAGQQLTTGAQAEAYANHFIAVHIAEMGGGKTYAQLSAESLANPTNTQLSGLVATVFRGETLRGLLLNAYAFWKMGQIALYAAIAAYVGAGLMLLLSLLGFMHLRRAPAESEVQFGLHVRPLAA
ncbi:MAG TPA: hypothetical protein VN108_10505 [Marmoricola sp.]|nr:hypothetical protein [Marmoricola sp.]